MKKAFRSFSDQFLKISLKKITKKIWDLGFCGKKAYLLYSGLTPEI